ncbi:MAG: hypothetical protein FJ279_21350 [Planctomycetes bacterium]|nr:hypothetical protein [Planctomycetota bacterium]
MRKPKNRKSWTVVIRKSTAEYVAICLELNLAARGYDIPDVQKNLQNAISDYLEFVEDEPETQVQPIPTNELIEFLKDTQPTFLRPRKPMPGMLPLEVNEVPLYV